MDDLQRATRLLVQQMLDYSGLTPTQLARAAGLSHTTVTRFLKGGTKNTLSARTISKLADASGVRATEAGKGAAVAVATSTAQTATRDQAETQPGSVGVEAVHDAREDVERRNLYRVWLALNEPQRRVLSTVMEQMVRDNRQINVHSKIPCPEGCDSTGSF